MYVKAGERREKKGKEKENGNEEVYTSLNSCLCVPSYHGVFFLLDFSFGLQSALLLRIEDGGKFRKGEEESKKLSCAQPVYVHSPGAFLHKKGT